LTKKESAIYTQKDLSDLIYEEKCNMKLFVNTLGSNWMTTVLVVVNKKKDEQFFASYETYLKKFYENDFENWKKRTKQ